MGTSSLERGLNEQLRWRFGDAAIFVTADRYKIVGARFLRNFVIRSAVVTSLWINILCKKSYWIELAQDRNRWRALVNAVMTLRFQ